MTEPHRKQLQRFEQFLHLHELTFSCFHRKPLLTDETRLRIVARSVESACQDEHFQLAAFVIMPEHIHLLVRPQRPDSSVSRFLARLKQPASKQIRTILETEGSPLLNELTVQERPGKLCFRFWQEGAGFDRNLYTPAAVSASIDYIHTNPVKRGLCQRATDFKWSSARFHLQNTIDDDLPKLTPLDPEWFQSSGAQVIAE